MRSLCFLVYLNEITTAINGRDDFLGKPPGARWGHGCLDQSFWGNRHVFHLETFNETDETNWKNRKANLNFHKFSVWGEDWSSRLDFTNSLFLNPPARIDGAAGEWWIGQGPGDSFQDTFNFFFDLTSFDKPFQSFASLGWTPSRPFYHHQSCLLSKG